jgi:hypothetical protein
MLSSFLIQFYYNKHKFIQGNSTFSEQEIDCRLEPDVESDWLARMIRTRQVPSSNLGLETVYLFICSLFKDTFQ